MNWGKGITIAMILFIGFIITLTWIKLSKVNASTLVVENYYEREVNYEQEIQSERNANELGRYEIATNETQLNLTLNTTNQVSDVVIYFSRPNNAKQDKKWSFGSKTSIQIEKEDLVKGIYQLEITYKIAGKECLQKEEITI
jgi:hypothetical protein